MALTTFEDLIAFVGVRCSCLAMCVGEGRPREASLVWRSYQLQCQAVLQLKEGDSMLYWGLHGRSLGFGWLRHPSMLARVA